MSENDTSLGVGTQSNPLPVDSATHRVLKSKIRPGNIDTCRSCPGSLMFKQTVLDPLEPPSPVLIDLMGIPHDFMSKKYGYQKRGIYLHRLISARLGNFKLPYPVPGSEAILEKLYAQNPRAKKIVDVCCDYTENQFLKDTSQDFYIEEFLDCLKDYNITGFYGRCDAALVSNDSAEIIDFKTGLEPISPEESLQLLCYAAGIRAKHPNICKFTLTVIQLDCTFEYTPSSYYLSADEVDARIRKEVIPIVLGCEVGQLTFNIGTHCSKCPHLYKCTAGLQYYLLPILKKIESTIISSNMELDTQEFIPFIHLKSAIGPYFDKWREHLIRAQYGGTFFPNLQFKKLTKEVYDDEDAVSIELSTMNIDPYNHTLKSPKELRDALGESFYLTHIAPHVRNVYHTTAVSYRS